MSRALAQLFKLLSDANRLSILFALEEGERSVSQIIEATGLSQPLVSFHLKALREAYLVRTNRKGTFAFNELCDVRILAMIRAFEPFAKRLSGDEKIASPFPGFPWMKG